MVWLRNPFEPVDWCSTWWFSHIKQTSTICQYKGNAKAVFVGTFPQSSSWGLLLLTDSSKELQDSRLHTPGRSGERHGLGRRCWSECRDCKIICLLWQAMAKQTWEDAVNYAGGAPASLEMVQLLVVCVCPWPAVMQGSTTHVWEAWEPSWAWQGNSGSLYKYQLRETPVKPWSLDQIALLCNLKKAAKGHQNVSSDREHTFSEGRKKENLSAYWRQSWEVSANLFGEALCGRKELLFPSAEGPNEVQKPWNSTGVAQTRTHRRQKNVENH